MIRPEPDGKLLILGFFGICPHVELRLPRVDQPAVLTFLVTGGPGDGALQAFFDVVDDGGQIVASTIGMPFTATPTMRTTLAAAFVLTFGHVGRFALRLLVSDVERFRAHFDVAQAVLSPDQRL